MKKFYLSILVFFALLALASCSGGKGLKAKTAFEIGEYDRAERLFIKAAGGEKSRYNQADYAYHLAECYKRKGMYKKAASSYQAALKYKHKDNDIYYLLAQCQLASGQYDKAEENFEMYKAIVPFNARLADQGIAACRLARDNKRALTKYDYKNPPDTGYIVRPVREFNSKSSDYSPAFVGDDYEVVYFTSMRSPKKRPKINRVTGQANSTIYMSKVDGGGEWTVPESLGDPFSVKFDDGTPSLTADGKTMYFTRCPYDAERENNAECYETRRSGGRWGDPVRVLPGGDSTMMVAHPAISPDGQTLYFVSDREGGIGGKDIYFTTKEADGSWSAPQNAGGIVNTKGDEMFPYVRDNGDLYFSSNGHLGFGGLDIFKAVRNEKGRYEVTNMGLPVNSSADDFGIVFKGNKEEGYFSSSRQKAGIDNIFSFLLPEVVLMCDGKLTDAQGGALRRAFVKVIGSDGTNLKLKPNDDGNFGFRADPGVVYLIQFGARGYISQKMRIDTNGKSRSETIPLDIKLQKVE
ncbi:MAG: tetratricopeptide repeat protein [Bacteroidales bacterium]|nr:tetratricopeptide repeat protein [Bacteroidales bacterium]